MSSKPEIWILSNGIYREQKSIELDTDKLKDFPHNKWVNEGLYMVPRLAGGTGWDLVLRVNGTYYDEKMAIGSAVNIHKELFNGKGLPILVRQNDDND